MKNKFLILIIALAFILRFWRLGEVPAGLHQDEVSQGYNTFSILATGRDRYGQFLPILFRTFGSYQPPVYTYLALIPVFLFGNSVFAIRSVSALFGVLTVILTYFLVKLLVKQKNSSSLALAAALVVAISPWAIHFSRRVVEANTGLFFAVLAFYFFFLSLKRIKFFLPACLVFGIATHTYYSEQLIAVIFLPTFLLFYRNYFWQYKKQVIVGLVVFGLILVLHLVAFVSGAFAVRFSQVGSAGDTSVILAFVKHFLGYLAPKNLFSDTGVEVARISPGLSVFYGWFFISLLAGLYFLPRVIDKTKLRFLAVFAVITLIPVSLTGDIFYPLRALEFFWLLSIVIAVGLWGLGRVLKPVLLKWGVLIVLVLYSLGTFYVSYFIFYQNETMEPTAAAYRSLIQELAKHPGYRVVLDSVRDPGAALRIAYFMKFDPTILQKELKKQLLTPYYSNRLNGQEVYVLGNLEARPLAWGQDDCSAKTILVGDKLTFSEDQIKQHHLTEAFKVLGPIQNVLFFGYVTNPDQECKLEI